MPSVTVTNDPFAVWFIVGVIATVAVIAVLYALSSGRGVPMDAEAPEDAEPTETIEPPLQSHSEPLR